MARGGDGVKARVWRERLARFEEGGMTIAEFCGSEGTSTASFYAWRRKLAMRHQTKPHRSPQQQKNKRQKKRQEQQLAGRGAFEPLTIAAAAVVIRLPDGTSIEVPAASQDALRTIVGQLAGADVEAARC